MGRQTAIAADLPSIFSSTLLRELVRTRKSVRLVRILEQSAFLEQLDPRSTLGDVYDSAFAYLKILGRRDEYIYRSAISQKLVMGRHSLRTATLLNEVRVASSKVDMVVLNGTSTAYELKSERDTLSRLAGQLADYSRVYASTYVVTSPAQAPEVLATTAENVGVLILTPHFTLATERAAVNDTSRLDPALMLDTMRLREALELIARLGLEIPNVPNTQMRSTLQRLVKQFDPHSVHAAMLGTLKSSRSQSALQATLNEIPRSLHAAVLKMSFNREALGNMRDAMATPLQHAVHWR
ncbi:MULTISPECIES: sce7726 family protein [Clavibacter]|uniref:Sce7726 family protein n=1 Tax=Clavibacter seminis TaxID=2860285 RepID=A0ABY3TF56_9MICO|nr:MULTISPECIES: sce7726 family protein [Clavibacter]UKF25471.1 sce7726 family protein [Clavibacter sp. A6099]